MSPHNRTRLELPVHCRAFTLIEMLTVMAVISILVSLVVAVNAFAQKKSALTRAEGEIRTMSAACESYKADMGGYPRDGSSDDAADSKTDSLCPMFDGDPIAEKYQNACLILYKSLSGDENADGKASGKLYCEFRPNQLKKSSDGEIKYIQDPFGNSYGYSTNGAFSEEFYRSLLERNPGTRRPKSGGFNPTFDLWSTGGVVSKESAGGLNSVRKRWVKNW